MLIRTSNARDLATRALEMGALVLRGELARHGPDGWTVGGQSVTEWLTALEGEQVYLIAIGTRAGSKQAAGKRTCRTCGREYEGHECPYCREARLRLRGR